MSERQPGRKDAPPCPMCMSETDVKRIYREPTRDLVVYKCRSCNVEYPVVTDR
jgi:transposase-like protein